MKEKGWLYIYPAYLDASRSRSFGRKIPFKLAVEKPKLMELMEAAKKLGLEVKASEEAKYPKTWWEHRGCLMVRKEGSKTELLRKLSSEVKNLRSKAKSQLEPRLRPRPD